MVDIILVLLLVFGFFTGLRRGFILQAIHLISFAAAFIMASLYYDVLAPKLASFIPMPDMDGDSGLSEVLGKLPMETVFYNVIAFATIFIAVKILLRIIASMLNIVAELPVLHFLNRWMGAFLGFLEIYLILFVVLYILSLTPMDNIQSWINQSRIAMFMIENTPFLSEQLKNLLFTTIKSIF